MSKLYSEVTIGATIKMRSLIKMLAPHDVLDNRNLSAHDIWQFAFIVGKEKW